MTVLVSAGDEAFDVHIELIRSTAEAALAEVELTDVELSVMLCDDATIEPLNAQWRGKESPTDVLSFPQYEDYGTGPVHPRGAGQADVLGDVVISIETAQRQAAEIGHGLDDEIRVLLVHGLCHLLGYDHIEADEAAEMKALEARILEAVGGGEGLIDRAGGDPIG